MKRLLISIVAISMAVAASAVPAKPGVWRTVTLTDGTTVRVQLVGDENLHFWRAADGKCYRSTATAEGIFEQVDYTTLLSPAKKAAQKKTAPATPKKVISGSKRALVVLVEFADKHFAEGNDKALYDKVLNQENYADATLGFRGSVSDYFRDQSNGQLKMQFDIAGPVVLPETYAYYGKNDRNGADIHYPYITQMVTEATTLAKAEVADWEPYDWDNDGFVDNVVFVYAGHSESSYDDANAVWAHSSYVYPPVEVGTDEYVYRYACTSELGSAETIDGIGAFCHEFSHCLGLPDFYDTSSTGGYGMSQWDVMAEGLYNGDAFCPAAFTAYEKWFCGWTDEPTELGAEPQQVDGMKPLTASGKAYIMYNDANKDEYYLLENRQQTGWDTALPGAGLVITHVDYSESAWNKNAVNADKSHQRMVIVPADYTTTSAGIATDAWPSKGNHGLTNNSKPAAKTFNANTDGETRLNKCLLDIMLNAADSTISFRYATKEHAYTPVPEGAILFESFDDCTGIGGNDAVWGGSDAALWALCTDNSGWEYSKAAGANQCAMFGIVRQRATITTPTFTIDEGVGTAEVSFLAAPNTDKAAESITIKVYKGTGTLTDSTFTLTPGQWNNISTTLTGSGEFRLRIQANAGPLFVDNFCIAVPASSGKETNGIHSAGTSSAPSTPSPIYTLDGRYAGNTKQQLPHGVYIRNGKKILK